MMSVKKKLIIDGQIFQTSAKDRGMGRYSQYLISNLLKSSHNYDEVELIITSEIFMSQYMKDSLKDIFKGAKLKELYLKIVVNANKIDKCFKHNEKIINEYVESQISLGYKVDFLIPSLFQEPLVSVFPKSAKKLLIFYDLIPYLYHNRYQPVMGIGYENYLKRFRYLYSADMIFTISKTVLDDLHVYLGIPHKKLTCIDGAAIRSSKSPERPKIPVPEKYILMPTSDDLRKNNLMAVLGFEEFIKITGNYDYKLLITSKINDNEKEHLQSFSKNIIFTGNLTDEQLDWLYERCWAVLFVPEYEGLGLPVLEAAEFNKKVVCSSIGAFREISTKAFTYCDHTNPGSIAEALNKALISKPTPAAYESIRKHYTWPMTASRLLSAIPDVIPPVKTKPKVAIFAPTASGYSAIGKSVMETHAVMSEHFDVDYYIEKGLHQVVSRPNILQYVANTYPAESFSVKAYAQYDAVIYHVGNGDYHLESIKNGLYLPGYAVVHDTKINEAYRVMGELGIISPARVGLELNLDEYTHDSKGLSSILNAQLGALAHSNFAQQSINRTVDRNLVTVKANLPVPVAQLAPPKSTGPTIIGLAGILADVKGIELIEAMATMTEFSDCQIRLFGFNFSTQEMVERLNNYPNVTVTVGPTDLEFQNNLNELDILVNYRLKYNGETSLSTIEAMRSGVAVVVRDIGWYAELPDDVAVKVKTREEIYERVKELVKDKKQASELGKNAKKYVDAQFTHEQYVAALQKLLAADNTDNPNLKIAEGLKNGSIKSVSQYLKAARDSSLI